LSGEKMRGEERMEKLSGVGEGRRGEETSGRKKM
jgi:hypothetical protein